MSQVTGPIAINDGTATAKSFLPMVVASQLSIFTERSASFSAAYPKLTATFDPANGGRKTNRIGFKVDLPVTETVAGIETVTRTLRFEGTFIVPDTATATDRANLHAFVANGLDDALISGIIKNLDPLY